MGGGQQYSGTFVSAEATNTRNDEANIAGNSTMVAYSDRQAVVPRLNQALVLALQEEAPLTIDKYGTVIVYIAVGDDEPMAIHKKLLIEFAQVFEEHFGTMENPTGDRIHLRNEKPAAFRLFIEYLYSGSLYQPRKIPVVTKDMTAIQKSSRLVALCQLFVFSENFYLSNEFSNKVMDAIQDGFVLTGGLPEGGLIRGIYQNTHNTSKLRAFCAHSLAFGICSAAPFYASAGGLLQQNRPILDDYLEALKLFTPGRDPRIRDCRGDDSCAECVDGRAQAVAGYWPCAFHTHDITQFEDNANCDRVYQDSGCYLWKQ